MYSAWRLVKRSQSLGMKLVTHIPKPKIEDPNYVLIKVKAASINPLDVAMASGYGSRLLQLASCSSVKSGIVLGRDYSGIVETVGKNVTDFKKGDEVYGALFPTLSGTFSQYIVISSTYVSHKPCNLSHEEAASLPFGALTAWSALKTTGRVQEGSSAVCVLGASGGVGILAIQLLKAWNCDVVGVCSKDRMDLLASFGLSDVISSEEKSHRFLRSKNHEFDIILNCSGRSHKDYVKLLKPKMTSCIVNLDSPVLSSIDSYGLCLGGAISGLRLLIENKNSPGRERWAYFHPSSTAMKEISHYVETKKLRPLVRQTFPFSDLLKAFETFKNRGGGKEETDAQMNRPGKIVLIF